MSHTVSQNLVYESFKSKYRSKIIQARETFRSSHCRKQKFWFCVDIFKVRFSEKVVRRIRPQVQLCSALISAVDQLLIHLKCCNAHLIYTCQFPVTKITSAYLVKVSWLLGLYKSSFSQQT
jgi:hypothetical protein